MSKESIKVVPRFRSLLPRETQFYKDHPDKQKKIYHFHPDRHVLTVRKPYGQGSSQSPDSPRENGAASEEFTFDGVFRPDTGQADFYSINVRPLVDQILKGYNATVFAYGASGTGKTYTIFGPDSFRERIMKSSSSDMSVLLDPEAGVIPRMVHDIFAQIEESKEDILVQLECSYVEIYCEQFRDLLNPGKTVLKLRGGDAADRPIYIEGAEVVTVESIPQLLHLLRIGESHRTVGATDLNDRSSRSHSVLSIKVMQTHRKHQTRKTSKLFLVDLAGSERVERSHVKDQALKEAQTINLSLSTLASVINDLTTSKSHIRYRDSKLTHLLSNALGGNSKTVLLLTCSPSYDSHRETYDTLKFGQRAKKIRNEVRINEELSVESYKAMVDELRRQLTESQGNYARVVDALQSKNVSYADVMHMLLVTPDGVWYQGADIYQFEQLQ
jgi:kinesin family protein 5